MEDIKQSFPFYYAIISSQIYKLFNSFRFLRIYYFSFAYISSRRSADIENWAKTFV